MYKRQGEYETATIKDMYGKEMLVKDVLLITTPSSLKYMKCGGSYEEWKIVMSENWAICKYEKPQHHFNRMVQTCLLYTSIFLTIDITAFNFKHSFWHCWIRF